jgi:hypothetical protein
MAERPGLRRVFLLSGICRGIVGQLRYPPTVLSTQRSLGDIEDVEGFVHMVLSAKRNRLAGLLSLCDEDEIVAEGVVLLYELFPKWDPKRCARFSGYALSLLPLRLTDWYRRELRQTCRGSFRGDEGGKYTFFQVVPLHGAGKATTLIPPSVRAYGPDE